MLMEINKLSGRTTERGREGGREGERERENEHLGKMNTYSQNAFLNHSLPNHTSGGASFENRLRIRSHYTER